MNPDDSKAVTNYWFLITSRGYWARLQKVGYWAFAKRKLGKVEALEPGHKGIVYLTRDGGRYISAIAAVVRFTGTASGESFDGRTAFDAFFPIRVPIEVETCPIEPTPFKPLIPDLEFIFHKKNWGSLLQGQPLKPLPESDFNLMKAKLMEAVEAESQVRE